MSKLDDILGKKEVGVTGMGGETRVVNLNDDKKQQIKHMIKVDIIKAYSSYPSHYTVADVLADQLARVEEL